MSSFPSGLNLKIWCPACTPALAAMSTACWLAASVTHTLPSRSTRSPWGQMNMPRPKLLTILPFGSNLKIVSMFLILLSGPRQSIPKRPPDATGTGLVSSHRMTAQMLSPSTSTYMEAGGPAGLLAHSPPGTNGPPPSASPLTGRYGLGKPPCAKDSDPAASNATMAAAVIIPIRRAFDMGHLFSEENQEAKRFVILAALGQRIPKRSVLTSDRRSAR